MPDVHEKTRFKIALWMFLLYALSWLAESIAHVNKFLRRIFYGNGKSFFAVAILATLMSASVSHAALADAAPAAVQVAAQSAKKATAEVAKKVSVCWCPRAKDAVKDVVAFAKEHKVSLAVAAVLAVAAYVAYTYSADDSADASNN
jgi:hypothetical protein